MHGEGFVFQSKQVRKYMLIVSLTYANITPYKGS